MTDKQAIFDESEILSEHMFTAIQQHLNGGSGKAVAIGQREVSVILQSLAKLSGYFLGRSPEEQIDEFADLVRHNQSHAAADIAAHQKRIS